jgi:spermidine/putrescine transport system permease protein
MSALSISQNEDASMTSRAFGGIVIKAYVVLFLAFMILPLVVMAGAAFNDTRFPSIYPWYGLTSRWFEGLWEDGRMWGAARNTVFVGLLVVAISVPLGTAGAILLNSLQSRARSLVYGVMVAPILTPGAVIGVSTLLFWNRFDVPAGLHLSILGQVSFIAAYVMLLVLARLQSFDPMARSCAAFWCPSSIPRSAPAPSSHFSSRPKTST